VVNTLLSGGANPNQPKTKGTFGSTALHLACQNGHLHIAVALLAGGADVQWNRRGDLATPLHAAALAGNIRLAKLLVAFGADPCAETAAAHRGETAAVWATAEVKCEVAKWLRMAEARQIAVGGPPWCPPAGFPMPPFGLAIAQHLHTEAVLALRLGRIDSDACVGSVAAILGAAHGGCSRSLALARSAFAGWSPSRHWLHHAAFRAAVRSVLLTAQRLEHGAAIDADAGTIAADSSTTMTAFINSDNFNGGRVDSGGCVGNGMQHCVSRAGSRTDTSAAVDCCAGNSSDCKLGQAAPSTPLATAQPNQNVRAPIEIWHCILALCRRADWPVQSVLLSQRYCRHGALGDGNE
jgi:hypothetical protein